MLRTQSAPSRFARFGLLGVSKRRFPITIRTIAASGAEADRVEWSEHIEEFRHVRLATISLFRNLSAEAWMRTGIASNNRFSVRAMAFITAGHVTHHVKILRERYL